MKKFLPLILLTGFSSPVLADITHRMTSSTQLITNAAATQVERIGSTYTVSGSGVTMDVGGGNSADNMVGGIGSLTDGVGQGSIATATQTSQGVHIASLSHSLKAMLLLLQHPQLVQ